MTYLNLRNLGIRNYQKFWCVCDNEFVCAFSSSHHWSRRSFLTSFFMQLFWGKRDFVQLIFAQPIVGGCQKWLWKKYRRFTFRVNAVCWNNLRPASSFTEVTDPAEGSVCWGSEQTPRAREKHNRSEGRAGEGIRGCALGATLNAEDPIYAFHTEYGKCFIFSSSTP